MIEISWPIKKRGQIMDYFEKYKFWCENIYFDQKTQDELRNIQNEEEIKDRFYRDLEFGTGGLRGVIGAGTNRMNLYTVRKATQGLANFICKENGQSKGVAIAYDSRHMSFEFANEAALCLNANGIKTYLFDALRPTPELSFAVRKLGCIAGIVVTASHNPPEYNGYKVYWEDGAQITYPKDKQIIEEVNRITDYSVVKIATKEEAVLQGYYQVVGEEIDAAYLGELKKLVLNPESIHAAAKDLKIVYTPLHGTGNVPVQRLLSELGFEQVYVVKEQEKPDGDFPTVSYPNPEDQKAFALGLELAKQVDADLILATDPDADRLGVYAKDTKTGTYQAFTGNMSGMLICEYELSERKNKGILPSNGALVTTIVSTQMAAAVADYYQIKCIETLTGFKYIGEQIKFFEQEHFYEYLFGFEESYGCLIGTHARDKDAIVAVMALCEAAAFYKTKGKTLWDQMLVIYDKYGYFKEGLYTQTRKGMDGAAQITGMVEKLRNNPPKQVGSWDVLEFRDYEKGEKMNLQTGLLTATNLPKSNVLYFTLKDDAWFCVRPSGTEPKIKFYIGVKGEKQEDADQKLEELTKAVIALF